MEPAWAVGSDLTLANRSRAGVTSFNVTDQIKNTVTFTGVAIGATATLPHHLMLNGKRLVPDSVRMQLPSFALVSADNTNLTVRNVSSAAGACVALVEAWHPVERQFGAPPDDGSLNQHLIPQPFAEVPGTGVGSGPVPVVVFRPGGVAVQNVVTTWSDAVALLSLSQGTRILEFDDRIVSPIVIPTGGPYDMEDVVWSGGADARSPLVHVPEGVTFINLRRFDLRIQVVFTGATPPVADFNPAVPEVVVIDRGASITTTGSGPFFRVTGVAPVIFGMKVGASFVTGTHAVLDLASGAGPVIVALVESTADLQSSTVSSADPSPTLIILTADSGINGASESQPAFSGTLVPTNNTKVRRFSTDIVSGNTVLTDTEQIVLVDPSGGAFSITLPLAFNHRGQSVLLKNVTSSVNNLTLQAQGGDNIDGNPSVVLSADHFFFQVTSDGVNTWLVTT